MMNMHLIDWCIVAAFMALLVGGAVSTARYARSVSGFLSAERCGGRYLVSVATEISKVGVISLVWYFEQAYQVGFSTIWWQLLEGPIWIIIALTGWVIYRFRQTRAMTLAQFLEMRYSRNFRVFAGVVAFLAGIINFGIFPSVGARFFMAFCGLPDQFQVAGLTLSTFATLMLILLGVALAFTLLGGQITVMVTDFLQGSIANLVFTVLSVYLLVSIGWSRMSEMMLAAPPEQSPVHPFHIGAERHFNFFYFAINAIILIYTYMAWQGTAGYNSCAKSAHEAKMAVILGGWRVRVLMLVTVMAPIAVRTVLHHPDYAATATTINERLDTIEGSTDQQTETLRNQLRIPIGLGVMLPAGMLGLTCIAMLGAFISTHDTYLHSWGSILIQDVILPFRKKPFTPRQHLWLLRSAIIAVAIFTYSFSLVFRQTQYISMFLTITGAIFFGGAGAAIIGGLYWKWGNAVGAWAAMICGMTLAVAQVVIQQFPAEQLQAVPPGGVLESLAHMALWIQRHLTDQEMTFVIILLASTVYVVGSLMTAKGPFNMNKMLHRGVYAINGDATVSDAPRTWLEKLGFTREFTGRDRVVTYITLSWPLVWTIIFVGFTVYNLAVDVSYEAWANYWFGWTWFVAGCGIVVTVWFMIGGFRDLMDLFHTLRTRQADANDDGRVESHGSD